MSIVINLASTAFAVGASYTGYDSLFLRSDASVTASSADADQPIENAISWPTYGGGWRTSTLGDHEARIGFDVVKTAQCFAIHKHNLGTLGITIKLQSSSDAISWTDVTGSEQNPADDKTIFWIDVTGTTSDRFWRLLFTGHTSGIMRIGQIFIGPVLRNFNPPGIGWSPPNFAINNMYVNSRSDGGDFLGRSLIRRGSKTRFRMEPVTEEFVRDEWEPFMVAAEEHPFYFSWDAVNFPKEVAYCYVDKKIEIPKYISPKHLSASLAFVALQV